MPITLEESGLTETQYDALMYAVSTPVWQVIAHRYNLDFQFEDMEEDRINSTFWDGVAIPQWDVVAVMKGAVIKFYPSEPGGDTLPDISLGAVVTTLHSPSLFYDNDNNILYVYHGTTSGVGRISYTLDDVSHTEIEEVEMEFDLQANESITHISAAAPNRLYGVIKHSTRRTYQIRIATTTTPIQSNIYYQYPFESLAVVEFDGKDVIAAATQTPGAVKIKASGTTTTKTLEYSGGILVWLYRNGIFSNHYMVDVVDNQQDWRIRRSVRLAVTHDRLALTAYSANGSSKQYSFAGYRLYTSKSGKYWSLGNMLPIDLAATNKGLKVVTVGDSALAFDYGGLYYSACTLELGHSAPSMQVDISKDIPQYGLSQDSITSANIVLNNELGIYSDHAILNENHTIALYHYAGYRVNGVNELMLIGITEVDYIEEKVEENERFIQISARDRLSWMSDKFGSEDSKYWENQLIGGDSFSQLANTDTYGGLRHTAVQESTWKTNNNKLELSNHNKQGIAFNTFDPYVWNGTFECQFQLSQNSNSEFAGIVFRAVDKDNHWRAIYNQSDDKIKLIEFRNGTTQSIHAQSSTMSWSTAAVSNPRYLRVVFYYASIKVFSSVDGITWTERIDFLASGQPLAGTTANMLIDRGFTGYIGKGRHVETTQGNPPYTIPDTTQTPPNQSNGGSGIYQPVTGDPYPNGDYFTAENGYGTVVLIAQSEDWSVLYDFANVDPTSSAAIKYHGVEAVEKWNILSGEFDGDKITIQGEQDKVIIQMDFLDNFDYTGLDLDEEIDSFKVNILTGQDASATDVVINDVFVHRYLSNPTPSTYVENDTSYMVSMNIKIDTYWRYMLGSGGIRWVEIFGHGYFKP